MLVEYRLAGRKGIYSLIALMVGVAFFASCGGSHSSSCSESDGTGVIDTLKYAENLSIENFPDYTKVTVRNPKDTSNNLQTYILIHRDSVPSSNLPKGTIVKIPVSDALVYSTVHAGLISELGAGLSIGGVCNPEYIKSPELKERIKSGAITDCGASMSPDIERIIKLNPEIIMLSPFENNDRYAKVGELGIPIIECADYMETSALGRAEWVKFYGLLFGKKNEADSMFTDTESNYLKLKDIASKAKSRPKVLTDQRYGQIWNVPAGKSTMGLLIEDAGGTNPFASYRHSGSVPLAPEKVLGDAYDAEIWLVKYHQNNEKTLTELASDAPVNSRFKAFKDKKVFGCNTRYINYYEETPFHPDLLLRDMIIAVHPGLLPDTTLRYFKRMN